MSPNRFGSRFQILTFGESHGPALGVVIDGCPSQIEWDNSELELALQRRRPGGNLTSDRQEADRFELLSGVFENQTLGTPIALLVRNVDARSQDYAQMKYRQGHADKEWKLKFGTSDPRGGGRSSGRETLARVLAGAVAKMALKQLIPELKIGVFVSAISDIALDAKELERVTKKLNQAKDTKTFNEWVDQFSCRLPSKEKNGLAKKLLIQAKIEGESYGGTIHIVVENVPAGLGQPVFHKIKADLAHAVMGVGATRSFEFGREPEDTKKRGTLFHSDGEKEAYGGIKGGITTGDALFCEVQFKPTSSILDVAKKGRHDPCIVLRAVPVMEAMVALVLVDHLLWSRTDRA